MINPANHNDTSFIKRLLRRFIKGDMQKPVSKRLRRTILLCMLILSLAALYLVYTLGRLIVTGDIKDTLANANHHLGFGSINNAQNAYNEEHSKKSKEAIVVVDPGHGGHDEGTSYGKIQEKDNNLDVSLQLKEILKSNGIKVILTREEDVFVDLRKRAEIANTIGADLFVSVHHNSIENMPNHKGTEVLYFENGPPKDNKLDNASMANIFQKELVDKLGTQNNGIKFRPKLAVLRLTQMPAVIAEIAYLSNAEDRARLVSSQFKHDASEALASAVTKTLQKMGVQKDDTGKWKFE